MKYLAYPILAMFCLASCVSWHTPTAHFTPCLVKKNQGEAEATLSLNGLNFLSAYSPVKHLLIGVNLNAMARQQDQSFYQKGAELALGFYNTKKRVLYGFNAGYGVGEYNWTFHQFNDSISYSLQTLGNYRKYTLQAYLAFSNNPEDPEWFTGLSLKQSIFSDNSNLTYSYPGENKETINGTMINSNFEPCVFFKYYTLKKFQINTQAGMNISYDRSMFWPTQYFFLRIGLGFRF